MSNSQFKRPEEDKMKKLSVFQKVLVILVIIVGTVATALCIDNIIDNKKVTTKTTVTPVVTEIPIDLTQCGVSYVKVLLGVVDADEIYPPSFEEWDKHEIWKIYVFGNQSSVDESKLNDRWGNKVEDIVFNAKIDNVSQKITGLEEVWYFNQFGYLGGWDDGEGQFKLDGFCQKVDGKISWAKQNELIPLGSYSFNYPTDKNIKSWSDYNFTIKVYSGHVLSDEDLKILDFQTRAMHENTLWAYIGYIGPSSSNLGMFDIDKNNELIWNFNWSNPDYSVSEDTKINIPVGSEIVVETSRPGWKVETQRFVLVDEGYQITMIELSTSD